MVTLRARWVLPIVAPVLRDGWITVDGQHIVRLGDERHTPDGSDDQIDLGHVALLPGLVNVHTHLELSYLRGAVPSARRFTDWIRELMRCRRDQPDPTAAHVAEATQGAITELRAAGTAVIGDVSNTLSPVPLLERSALAARVFFELVRFRDADAEEMWAAAMAQLARLTPTPDIRLSVSPHAPYSVSPTLFQMIRGDLERTPLARTSIHLAESPEECELLREGGGRWRELLEEMGAWDPTWLAPGCSPAEYLDGLGLLRRGTLAVHCVHVSDRDLKTLARSGATLATCPRSNRHVGVGDPPVARFYEAGIPVAVGTDSLASVSDLNVFNELAAMRRLAPGVPAGRLLESATRTGAVALGFDDFGMIAPGARAALIAVEVPSGVDDIEEYLVGGISPDRVRWPLADLSEALPA